MADALNLEGNNEERRTENGGATPAPPVAFEQVLEEELKQVDARRAVVGGAVAPCLDSSATVFQRAFARGMLGAGLSGGGIRSATFNLGMLQGLAEKGLLPCIDYLSTVSGGGYIGTWLHAVIHRKHARDPRTAGGTLCRPVPGAAGDDPISFLRKYSNYLAPRKSIFSADLWVILAIWIRNMFLNLWVLIPMIAAVMLGVVALGLLHAHGQGDASWRTLLSRASGVATFFLLFWAVVSMGLRLRDIVNREFDRSMPKPLQSVMPWALEAVWCAVAVFAACAATGVYRTDLVASPVVLPGRVFTNLLDLNAGWAPLVVPGLFLLALFVLLQWTGGYAICYKERRNREFRELSLAARRLRSLGHHVWMAVLSAAATGGLAWLLFHTMKEWTDPAGPWLAFAFGPPLAVGCLTVGVALQIGFMGADYPDGAREWLSRVGATLLMISAAWIAVWAFAVFMPFWVAQLFDRWWAAGMSAVSAWLATTAAGVFAGYSGRTKNAEKDSRGSGAILELVAKVAPVVFLIGFLTAIGFGVHAGLRYARGYTQAEVQPRDPRMEVRLDSSPVQAGLAVRQETVGLSVTAPPGDHRLEVNTAAGAAPGWTAVVLHNHWRVLNAGVPTWSASARIAGLAAAVLLGVAFLFAGRVNINEFSMHHFYKNRLVRCYLGASRGRGREPNPWTGFDPKDDLKLSQLTARQKEPYYGPYPIVNTTVNLNRGSELAKQDRKADSFVFTPLYCGYTPQSDGVPDARLREHGFRPTAEYSMEGGPGMGTVMAISGAAANPNSGYHTSGPTAFLLTVFNVRLGWWLGNPRRDDATRRPGPQFALWPLVSELTGSTDDASKYVNLSDGGHFDNIGLYELVRRRCRYILIGDAEADRKLAFESLAGAIRKCRADFGVEIDIDLDRIRPVNGLSAVHCVMGTIRYPEIGDATPGLLLYCKASMTGDEPEDVVEFAGRNPDFPHQSTGDQFFDEAQFESYRQLGLHAIRTSLAGLTASRGVEAFFADARRILFPPITAAPGTATRLADTYSALLERLSKDPDLRYLDHQVLMSGTPSARPSDPEALRRGLFFCIDCIQLMENVFFDLDLPKTVDFGNPNNTGWMRVFRHWACQEDFKAAWDRVRESYNEQFQDFFQKLQQHCL